ncbi:MAG TPA: SRPBCC family protein [Chloroflexota bacterium]|jgi:hypothetical protein|nr:SRPBCC family protein [Chloroflexota bacterium]
MPGDALMPNPTRTNTGAVTVNAPPGDIWPWLVQIGTRRGGLYSYDWLDRLFGFLDRPSATRILPEFQRLAVGDKISLGDATNSPSQFWNRFARSEHGRSRYGVVWQFGLNSLDDQRTRLVSSGMERFPKTRPWWMLMRIMEPAAFIMTRRFLLGVKERSEALGASAS